MTIDERAAQLEKSLSAASLQDRAGELNIAGRGSMNKAALAHAIAEAEAAGAIDHGPTPPEAGQTGPSEPPAPTTAAPADDDVQPGTPEEVGRPELLEVAEAQAAHRAATMRVIGAPPETQED